MANYSCITSISLYNCALAHDGTYVVDFASRAAADSYYASPNDSYCSYKTGLSNGYYQRDNGYIKIDANADVLNDYGVNYCRWKNPQFDNMFFYGFVDEIIYSAPKTALLKVRIDPWTTYFDRIRVSTCFIEREHVCVDNVPTLNKIGVAEPITVNPDVVYGRHQFAPSFDGSSDYALEYNFYGVVCAGKKISYPEGTVGFSQPQDPVVGALPNTTWWYAFDLTQTGIDGMRDLIDKDEEGELTLPSKDIISFTLIPKSLVSITDMQQFPDWLHIVSDSVPAGIQSQSFDISANTMLNGYTPHNKKLICYPYQELALRSYDGSCVELQPEKFTLSQSGDISLINTDFFCDFALGNDSSMGIYPCHYDYEGSGTAYGERNFALGITINSFPTIPMNIDAYKQYLAYSKEQRKSAWLSMGLTAVGAAASLATGSILPLALASSAVAAGQSAFYQQHGQDLASGNVTPQAQQAAAAQLQRMDTAAMRRGALIGGTVAGVTQGINQAQQLLYSKAAAQRNPNIMTSPATGQLQIKLASAGAWLEQRAITLAQAKLIDNYFTHYGYQVSKFDAYPQWRSRQNVNYIKTSGCQVYGTIPTIYQNQLATMINNGLTVFHGPANYDNFSLNNPIVNASADQDSTPYM